MSIPRGEQGGRGSVGSFPAGKRSTYRHTEPTAQLYTGSPMCAVATAVLGMIQAERPMSTMCPGDA